MEQRLLSRVTRGNFSVFEAYILGKQFLWHPKQRSPCKEKRLKSITIPCMGSRVTGERLTGSTASDFLFYFYFCCVHSSFNFISFKLSLSKSTMIYTSLALTAIRSSLPTKRALAEHVWNTIVRNGISKAEPTRRGIRAGCHYTQKVTLLNSHGNHITTPDFTNHFQPSEYPSDELSIPNLHSPYHPELNIQVDTSAEPANSNNGTKEK